MCGKAGKKMEINYKRAWRILSDDENTLKPGYCDGHTTQ